jgi:3-hydroxy-9,10-secoandrosta-1,3,5(10)-triene-9,17-dione monooxygenase reductase component
MSLEDQFKTALSCWASGVSVVATRDEGHVYGLTVSSFSSLSLHPPLILCCLNNTNRMPSMIESANGFTVSILGSDQVGASNAFARRGREPSETFEGAEEGTAASGRPYLDGSAAWLDCVLEKAIVEGDHTIVIGRVVEIGAKPETEPLLYFQRAYRTVCDLS